MTPSAINQAIEVLRNNGVIAHYTDTVVGFACLPTSFALTRLQRIKHRQNKQGFILLASSVDQVQSLISCTPAEQQRLAEISNRPTTWIVNANNSTPNLLISEHKQVAIRITQHGNIKPITEALGPIVSTSANLTNLKTCLTPNEVRIQFATQVDYVVKSDSPTQQAPSMIIDIHTDKVIRP